MEYAPDALVTALPLKDADEMATCAPAMGFWLLSRTVPAIVPSSDGSERLTFALPPGPRLNGDTAVVLCAICEACRVYPEPAGTQSVYMPLTSATAVPATAP